MTHGGPAEEWVLLVKPRTIDACFLKWGYTNGGTPIAGWFIRENSTKMDDWGQLYFRKPPDIMISTVPYNIVVGLINALI